MVMSKRQQNRMERQLIAILTDACEVAKAEIPGFEWLTHDTGNQAFPAGLRVTWIFDTQANLEQALANGEDKRMRALTELALEEIDLDPKAVPKYLQFDSEEACLMAQDGDWLARLAQIRRSLH